MLVEGGYTRLMAIYKDAKTERIGSVRSSRPYFLDFALENDALYVHFGASEQALSDIKKLGVNNINGMTYASSFWRDKSLKLATEHTAFTSMDYIQKGINKYGYRTTTKIDLLLNYSAKDIDLEKLTDKQEALNIDLKYSDGFTTNYIYDNETKVYKQSVNKKEHTDYETKKQYTVKNIITYQVSNNTIAGGGKGRQELSNIGSGKGYYITNGYAIPITWEKKTRSGQTIYKYMDGTEITVNDGNTWIHIVPTSGNISIS